MNQRIEKLKKALETQELFLGIEKARLVMESYKQSKGESAVLRRAKAQANVLNNINIYIEDNELIVGNGASKPMGVELNFTTGTWPDDEINALKDEGWIISKNDIAEIKVINEYWKGGTRDDLIKKRIRDNKKQWLYEESGVRIPPWTSKELKGGGDAFGGMSLGFLNGCILDYGKVLNEGLNSIIAEAEEDLKNLRITGPDSLKKMDFLKAVIIVLRGITKFAGRFAVLATEMAAKEKDPVRKKELERIAATCQWVPASPARNFYEAMQSYWFIFLTVLFPCDAALGRFDQFMYPFYRKDIEAGKINDNEVLELLQCLRIKNMQLRYLNGRQHRSKYPGMAKWNAMVIGGQTPDGKDATNDLTLLILEATKMCQTPHPSIFMRVHSNTPEALMNKALELLGTGIGLPTFLGDNSSIDYLLSHGMPLNVARDYAVTTNHEICVMGRSRLFVYRTLNLPLILEIFMHNGVLPRTGKQTSIKTGEFEKFQSFEELKEAFKKQIAYFMTCNAYHNNITAGTQAELCPEPAVSALTVDGIKEGKDIFHRTMPFENGVGLNAVGMINVADSLAVIKKLVYEEKRVMLKELKAALDANWKGYDKIREMCMAAPKFGNDDDYVDNIARELYRFFCDTTVSFDSVMGGKLKPTAVALTAQAPGGKLTGATPDGRYAGEWLADETLCPMRGRDTHGLKAVFKSASKIDQVPLQAISFSVKLNPSMLQTKEGVEQLSNLIRTYFNQGGRCIQFNSVDNNTLLDAQKHPEKHRGLIVRVGEYNTYFNSISKETQDNIIERTEYQKVA